MFAFLNTEIGGAYVEGLTGHPPAYWAEVAGKKTHDFINNASSAIEQNKTSMSLVVSAEDRVTCEVGTAVIMAMTRGMLEMPSEHLEKIGMEIGSLPEAMDARTDFYKACIEDSEVQGIGFTPENEFPIRRSFFPERAKNPSRKKEKNDFPWVVSIENIYVTSPNWDKEDQKARNWKGRDHLLQECYFTIEDFEFWMLVRRKSLHVEVLDRLKVQWAFQIVDGKPKNRRVLRVLEFNGEKLADPLPSGAIKAILGEYSLTDVRDQLLLF